MPGSTVLSGGPGALDLRWHPEMPLSVSIMLTAPFTTLSGAAAQVTVGSTTVPFTLAIANGIASLTLTTTQLASLAGMGAWKLTWDDGIFLQGNWYCDRSVTTPSPERAVSVVSTHGNVVAASVLPTSAQLVAAHEADAVGAHAASAISFSPTGTIAATTVQAAVDEVATDAAAALAASDSLAATDAELTAAIAAHEADTTSVHGITDTSTLYRAGGTDVAVADGGTGASTAAEARANLGIDGHVVMLPASNGNDDTSAINAILTNGGYIRGHQGQTYKLGSPLVIPSNTTLDMRGCTISLNAGSNCNMIRNAALAAGSGTDTNITVIGGTWDRGADDGGATAINRHSLMFQRVNGLEVRRLTYTSTAGKFGILVYACSGFEVGHISFNCASDGVHMSGTCTNGWVHDISGSTGDDSVAITTVDYSTYNNGDLGDAHDILVERIYTTNSDSTGNTVKLLPGNISGTPTTLYNVTVRNVYGSSAQQALYLGGDSADAGTVSGVLRDITVDGVENVGTGHAATITYVTVHGLTLRRLKCPPSASKYACQITTSAVIGDITFTDCYFTPPAGTQVVNMVSTSPQPSVTTMRFRGCRHNAATQSGGLITTASTGQTLTNVFIDDHVAELTAWALGTYYTTTNMWIDGLRCGTVNGWFNVPSGGTVDVKAAAGVVASVDSWNTGGTVKSRTLGFRGNVLNLTAANGDLFYNTNASAGCGVGPCVSNGTLWKNLYTGSTT